MKRNAATQPRAIRETPRITRVRRGRESESAFTSVELAIVAPVLLLLIFGIVHIGMLFHARNIVNDVAGATLREAQRSTSTERRAETVGMQFAGEYGNAIRNTSVKVNRSTQQVRVTVKADGIQIVPFVTTKVSRTVDGPVERFISEADRE